MDAWEAVAPMAEARENHAVVVLEGKLYAVGGRDNNDGLLSSVERYDAASNAWEEVAPMVTARAFPFALLMLRGALERGGMGEL